MNSPILLTKKLISDLQLCGVNTLHPPGRVHFPHATTFEPPCSIKWLMAEHSFELGAFSYGVSGYFFASIIGRYCSFGEQVQIGRHSHPLDFISTSPIFYLRGLDVLGVSDHASLPQSVGKPSKPPTFARKTRIGNDVYIGHGAFILPGVIIGDGAVIGACSVVTKDVPPYAIVAGSPATIKRYRFDSATINELLNAKWWEYAPLDLVGLDPARPHGYIERANDLRCSGLPAYNPDRIQLSSF